MSKLLYNDLFNLIKDSSYKTVYGNCDYLIKIIDNNLIYVLFEESHQKLDWIYNFLYIPIKVNAYHDMKETLKVTLGFIIEYKGARASILIDVDDAITQVKNNGYEPKIICSGWSHGGSICQLAAEDISYKFYGNKLTIKPDIISFGGSKVFYGKDTLNTVNSRLGKVILFQRQGDWVPNCPPKCTGALPLVSYTKLPGVNNKNIIDAIKNISIAHSGYGNADIYKNIEI